MKTIMTVRQALTQIRADLKADNVSYLSGARLYETDKGTMYVRNRTDEGGVLLGLFEAELTDKSGMPVKTYKI